jgi:hypothetical protein
MHNFNLISNKNLFQNIENKVNKYLKVFQIINDKNIVVGENFKYINKTILKNYLFFNEYLDILIFNVVNET